MNPLKRFYVIAGVILVILAAFVGFVCLRMRADRPGGCYTGRNASLSLL